MESIPAAPVCCHVVPGRLRVKLPLLKGCPPHGDRLSAMVRQLPGVTDAAANPTTGSLIVFFDPKQTEYLSVIEFFREQGGTAPEAPAAPKRRRSILGCGSGLLAELADWASGELAKELVKAALDQLLEDSPWSALLAVV
jgi:hypothetical protein